MSNASAAVLHDARERYDVPVVEVIRPAVRRAAAATRNGPVEVLAGAETIGTVDRDAEDGEVTYHVTISVLAEDLPNL